MSPAASPRRTHAATRSSCATSSTTRAWARP
jgi:hypothetical protein